MFRSKRPSPGYHYKTSKIRCSWAHDVVSRVTYKLQGDVLCIMYIYELLIAAATPFSIVRCVSTYLDSFMTVGCVIYLCVCCVT